LEEIDVNNPETDKDKLERLKKEHELDLEKIKAKQNELIENQIKIRSNDLTIQSLKDEIDQKVEIIKRKESEFEGLREQLAGKEKLIEDNKIKKTRTY